MVFIMAKILVDISSELIAQLDSIAQKEQLPRDMLICTAIKGWLSQRTQPVALNAFGSLKDKLIEGGVQWQKKVRDEGR